MTPNTEFNFMIITIDEYIQEIKYFVNRAGLMLSIDALLVTSLVLFSNSQPQVGVAEKVFTTILPLFFLGLAFWYYLQASLNAPSLVPIQHMKLLASQYEVAGGSEGITETFNLAKKSYEDKNKALQLGSSYFLVAIPTLVVTNLVSPTLLVNKLGFNNISIAILSILLAIIGTLISLRIYKDRFIARSKITSVTFNTPNPTAKS